MFFDYEKWFGFLYWGKILMEFYSCILNEIFMWRVGKLLKMVINVFKKSLV